MQCRHLVALGNVIGVAGDENDLHRIVVPAEFLGHGHAVHGPHFNVQKENVIVPFLGIVKQKAFGRGKEVRLDFMAGCGGPTLYHIQNILPVPVRVVTDGNFIFHIRFPSAYVKIRNTITQKSCFFQRVFQKNRAFGFLPIKNPAGKFLRDQKGYREYS